MNKLGKKKIQFMKKTLFLSPDGKNVKNLLDQVSIACKSLISHQGTLPSFPKSGCFKEDIESVKDPKKVMKNIFRYFGGAVKSNHNLLLRNVIPTPNFASLSSNLVASLLMANGVTSEDAGDMLTAEVKVADFLSKLVGINPKKSIGFFTWGGTATSFYGLKAGLFKAQPNHTKEGVKSDNLKIFSSWTGHYCQNTAANWLGVGEDNVIKVKSNFNHTTNLIDLEDKMRQYLQLKKRVAVIFCSGGSSANGSIDNIKRIWEIRNKLVKEFALNYFPHIHVDSVSGWVFLVFKDYDFKKNPYGFDKEVCSQIRNHILPIVSTLRYGDSYGFDFHKTGYCPYNSTVFLAKDKKDLEFLARDSSKIAPIFHSAESQNSVGFLYTMETSRSAANMLSTWIGLKTMGIQGLQLLIAKGLENAIYLKNLLLKVSSQKAGFLVIHPDLFATTIHIRVYRGNAEKKHKAELIDDLSLEQNNHYTKDFFEFINNSAKYSSKVSLSCSRGSFYLGENKKGRGIRVFFLNPFTNKSDVLKVFHLLMEAKSEFDKRRSA